MEVFVQNSSIYCIFRLPSVTDRFNPNIQFPDQICYSDTLLLRNRKPNTWPSLSGVKSDRLSSFHSFLESTSHCVTVLRNVDLVTWVSRQIHILHLTVAFCRSRVRTQLQCVVCIPTPSISCSQCSPQTEQLAAEQISSQPS